MKQQIEHAIHNALQHLHTDGMLGVDIPPIKIERTRNKKHGDFACNIALLLAKPMQSNPRQIAQTIIDQLELSNFVEKIEIAGPGFINFYLPAAQQRGIVSQILHDKDQFGHSQYGKGQKIQLEFVSANPTGPLHVGHGRGAAYGATLANLLTAIGYTVHCEYYVNDAGRQMDILATSVWIRYLQLCGENLPFPSNAYKGEYVTQVIATTLYNEHDTAYSVAAKDVLQDLPPDEKDGGDKESYIDALITRCKKLLGDNRYRFVFELGLNTILDDIREDLSKFSVQYHDWYSERSLVESGKVNQCIKALQKTGYVYEQNGALWFRSSHFGDDKDRVIQRENGQTTYFASDIAYHKDKFDRGFDKVIDIWGADHHGYVPRVKAALKAMGYPLEQLEVLLVQFANLYRDGIKIPMTTRGGSFVTLRELREEAGNDATRFFYVMRRCEQHLDFDLNLAQSRSKENPVYYIQYAHARICSMLEKMQAQQIDYDQHLALENISLLKTPHESSLLDTLIRYPEVLQQAAINSEPHLLVHYLRELAHAFHTYYNEHKVLLDDPVLRSVRVALSIAVRYVIANGLNLLGVSAPTSM